MQKQWNAMRCDKVFVIVMMRESRVTDHWVRDVEEKFFFFSESEKIKKK